MRIGLLIYCQCELGFLILPILIKFLILLMRIGLLILPIKIEILINNLPWTFFFFLKKEELNKSY